MDEYEDDLGQIHKRRKYSRLAVYSAVVGTLALIISLFTLFLWLCRWN